MNVLKLIHFVFLIFISLTTLNAQQLMINEVSQGNGTAEYVEFVVVGSPICEGEPIPCIDLRGVVFDDNNSLFQLDSTNQTGIANGALRFSKDLFWSCIPQGTYIVVYNNNDRNNEIPADDDLFDDGNCRMILPGDSPLIESTNVSPTSSNPTYPTNDADWIAGGGWNGGGSFGGGVAMRNAGDSFFIPILDQAGTTGAALHAISWGNNEDNTIIYFPGSASGKVMNFKNISSDDYNDQVNWVLEDVSSSQTPGAANSPENDLWIGTMNPTCRVNPLLSFNVTNTDCNTSNGAIDLVVTNISNYDVLWNTGSTDEDLTNLNAGTYISTVTDNLSGCVYIDSTQVSVNNGPDFTPNLSAETCLGACDGNISFTVSGGTAPYTIAWALNGNGIPEPATNNFCSGAYDIIVADLNNCSVTQSVNLVFLSQLSYTKDANESICFGDSVSINVTTQNNILWETNENNNQITVKPNQTQFYTFTVSDNTCSVSDSILVSIIPCNYGIEFPNVFTPNGDDKNNIYEPIILNGVEIEQFTIFNRWGNIMYESLSNTIVWDGKVNSKDASPGTYFYKCVFKNGQGSSETLHGFITLIR